MPTPVLDTPRLLLRPLALADADEVQPLFAKWEIVRQLNARVPWPYPEKGAYAYYRDDALPAIEHGEEWHWMLRLKDDPAQRIIDAICLVLNGGNNRGFWIAQPWQGRGLMSEAVAAINRFWFEDLRQPVLRVKKARDNAASRAISLREGARCISQTQDDYVSGRLPTEVWELTVQDWRDRNSGSPKKTTRQEHSA
jgi:[ribosomal protein S5]-alanine N-acetyltransferase